MRYHRISGHAWRPALVAVVLVLGFCSIGQAQAVRVEGAFGPPETTDDAPPSYHAQQLTQDDTTTPTALSIILPTVTSAEQAEWALRDRTGPLQIGFGREIPAAYQDDLAPRLEWVTRSDGTLVSVVSVTSPGAPALRVAVSATLGPGATLRFFSPAEPDQRFDPLTQQDFASQTSESSEEHEPQLPDLPVWSPVIDGETVGIEITLPSSPALAAFSLYVDQVSHLVSSVPRYEPQRLSEIGNASCDHIDVQCSDQDVDPQASATAKMIFTTEDGFTGACTGTLLTDSDASFIPYFLTAHHCIGRQSVARTLDTYWNFERASCEGDAPTTVTQLTGGADLLVTHAESDSSLLRLRSRPPGSRLYAGWSSETLDHPSDVYGVHHPAGDLKKYSAGTTTRFIDILLGPEFQEVKAIDVTWSQGTAEPGSSGSGLFDANGDLRGVASGIPPDTDCATSAAYGRFDRFFPLIGHHLAPNDTDEDTLELATSVNLSSSTSRALEDGEDIDYFRVEVAQAGTLTVETTGSTDTVGHLRGADGQWLSEDDDGGSGLNFRLVRQVSAGTYYVRVSGFENTSGPYTLIVRFTPTLGDDHGGTLEGAASVPLNSSTSGALEGRGDIDYFRVEVAQAGTLTVETTGSTDTFGHLRGADGQWLSEDDDGGSRLNFRLVRQVSAGTYYVRVSGFENSIGRYTLLVRFTTSPPSGSDL